jgi:PAS domain S-box-containing protein
VQETQRYIDLSHFLPDWPLTSRLDQFCHVLCHLFSVDDVCIMLRTTEHHFFLATPSVRESWLQRCFDSAVLAPSLPNIEKLTDDLSYQTLWQGSNAGSIQLVVALALASDIELEDIHYLSLSQIVEAMAAIVADAAQQLSLEQSFLQSDIIFNWCQQTSLQLIVEREPNGWRLFDDTGAFGQLNAENLRSIDSELWQWINAGLNVAQYPVRLRISNQSGNQCAALSMWSLENSRYLITIYNHGVVIENQVLRRRQSFLDGGLDSGLAGFIAFNHHLQPMFINDKAKELLQLADAGTVDPVRQTFEHLTFWLQQDEDAIACEPFQFLHEQTSLQRCRCRVEYPGGHYCILEFRWTMLQSMRHHDAVLYCMFTDVTAQCLLQQTLTQIEHHLDHLIKHSPVVLYQQFNGYQNGFIYISPNVSRMLGCTDRELMQSQSYFLQQVHPEDQQQLLDCGVEANVLEYRLWHSTEKTYIWVKDIREEDPNIKGGVLGAMTNISARKQAELDRQLLIDDLDKQRQLVTLTLNSLLDGVVTIDQRGTILSCNPMVSRLFGYSLEELLGHNVSMLMPEPDMSAHDGYLANYMRSGEARIIGIGRRVFGKRKTGGCFPLHLSVTELPEAPDKGRRFVGCLHDLTEFEQQQQQLLQASKLSAVGTLTSGIAHDFNNILGIVRGYAELLASNSNPAIEKPALAIMKAADRGGGLIKNLLEFSSNRARETQTLELNQLIGDISPLLQEACGSRVQLTLVNSQSPLWLELEKGGLENALLNLVINARQAISGNGSITVSCQQLQPETSWLQNEKLSPGSYALLQVQDSGSGMSEEVKAKVFEPFFSTKGAHGTGLGLAQVFGFVRRSKGTVQVDSVPGQGSVFSLYFPVNLHARAEVSVRHETQMAEGIVILIVDDEPELLELHATMLEIAGFQVLKADTGEAALRLLQQHKVAALVSDIVMPGMNGIELARHARLLRPGLPVQLVSGYADDTLATDDAGKMLLKNCMNKPVQTGKFIAKIQQLTAGD